MGFSTDEASAALHAHGGNEEAALNSLLTNRAAVTPVTLVPVQRVAPQVPDSESQIATSVSSEAPAKRTKFTKYLRRMWSSSNSNLPEATASRLPTQSEHRPQFQRDTSLQYGSLILPTIASSGSVTPAPTRQSQAVSLHGTGNNIIRL